MSSQYVQLPLDTGGGGGGAVDSFNGRTGVVVSQAGDYSAGIVSNTPAGNIAATTVQAAINELDTEKQATITGAASTVVTSNLTASRVVISNASGKLATTAVTHTEVDYVSGVTSSIQTQLNNKQGVDAELTAIAAITANGLITKTGTGTAEARTITAGSAAVSVTNGNGVSGNPTIDLPNSGVTASTYGSATNVPAVAVNAKGVITSATNTPIAIPSTQVTNFTTAAQTAAVQNALFPASTVKAPSVDAVVTALTTVLVNPMTTDGDMIYYDTGNQRLPIGNEDEILRVVSGLPAWVEENLYQDIGGGQDGSVTLSGSFTAPDMLYYDTLTIDAGTVFNPDAYIIYAKKLDLTNAPAGAIIRNGNNGGNSANNTGAAGGAAFTARVLATNGAGGTGATGQPNAGAQGGAGGAITIGNGGNGGASGASGAGGTGAAAAAIAGGAVTTTISFGRFEYQFIRGATQVSGGAGGRGGNSGGGDGANTSRGGGGGGAGGAPLVLIVGELVTGPSTPAGVIQAKGGNGGVQTSAPAGGNVGGAGGGGGGGGGYVYIAYVKKTGPTVTGLVDASGGNGGNGSNALGTGIGGNGGAGGNGGRIQLFNITEGMGTLTVGSAGSLGTAGAGLTGGVGGQGGTCKVDL